MTIDPVRLEEMHEEDLRTRLALCERMWEEAYENEDLTPSQRGLIYMEIREIERLLEA